jgi:effector-binding domain-containing protein
MSVKPEIVTRAEQPYAAIRAKVTMAGLDGLGARFAEVFAWLGAHGQAPVGAPFFRYKTIDMARELEVEAGVPIAAALQADGEGDVVCDVLPAGRYATVLHVGHPDALITVTADLQDWAEREGLRWDMSPGKDGEHWGCRLEVYLTDPAQEPDMSRWETQLAFRLADE